MDVGQIVNSQPQLVAAALLLSGIMLLLQAVGQAVSIWKNTRRQPPLDQELQYYAKKADVAAVEQRLRDDIRAHHELHERVMERHADEQSRTVTEIFKKIDELKRGVQTSLVEFARDIGKLDGRTEKKG